VTAVYGYGLLAAVLGVIGVFVASILKAHKLTVLDNQAGAAKQHAQDLQAQLDKAVKDGDDAAVQDALESELHRGKQ
jgi:hypothetical protein